MSGPTLLILIHILIDILSKRLNIIRNVFPQHERKRRVLHEDKGVGVRQRHDDCVGDELLPVGDGLLQGAGHHLDEGSTRPVQEFSAQVQKIWDDKNCATQQQQQVISNKSMFDDFDKF